MRDDQKEDCGKDKGGPATLALFLVTLALFPVTLAKAGAHKSWVPGLAPGKTKRMREDKKGVPGKDNEVCGMTKEKCDPLFKDRILK